MLLALCCSRGPGTAPAGPWGGGSAPDDGNQPGLDAQLTRAPSPVPCPPCPGLSPASGLVLQRPASRQCARPPWLSNTCVSTSLRCSPDAGVPGAVSSVLSDLLRHSCGEALARRSSGEDTEAAWLGGADTLSPPVSQAASPTRLSALLCSGHTMPALSSSERWRAVLSCRCLGAARGCCRGV